MNIQILDSWLREHLKTKATADIIAEKLSLSSVSVEKLEKIENDFLYDIEITTNRVDLMSIIGLAREAAAVLKHNNIHAEYIPPILSKPDYEEELTVEIKNNPHLVNRICAVIMDIEVNDSPDYVKKRLDSTGIRPLNNIIDITNYVMRTIGHPCHAFDFDKIVSQKINIRESQKDEKIITLDGKEYCLVGGDIIADDGQGNIIDLLGIMGLKNSMIDQDTKKILYFIDNNNPHRIRKTSMRNFIRTDAAILNEKGIDPELAFNALLYGIGLFQKLANGKVISKIIDIYPNKAQSRNITITEKKINSIIGVNIPLKNSADILRSLDFKVTLNGDKLTTKPPSSRSSDVHIQEDIVEEIARIYGYHNIPDKLPTLNSHEVYNLESNYILFEDKIRDALKYWGYNEVYTYPMVSEELYEGDTRKAVKIQNPLNEDFVYMRRTLIPSLLKVIKENKNEKIINIFEVGNVYIKNDNNLPIESMKLALVVKSDNTSFYKIKGLLESLFSDLGIKESSYIKDSESEVGVYIEKNKVGEIEMLDINLVNFELDLEKVIKYATFKKTYTPVSKFPPIIEDLALVASALIPTGDLINAIKTQSKLITDVSLLDKFEETRTFHIVYKSWERNLKNEEVALIRERILNFLKTKFKAKLKE